MLPLLRLIYSRRLLRLSCNSLLIIGKVCRNTVRYLTPEFGKLIAKAIDGLLSALPLQVIARILDHFVKTKTDVQIMISMITITTDRLAGVASSDPNLAPALAKLMSILTELVSSSEESEAIATSLICIAKLSRVHGKAELSLYENILPIIVDHGLGANDDVIVQQSLDCMLSMLYGVVRLV